MTYLARQFVGPVQDFRVHWAKHNKHSSVFADEFRAFVIGKDATAYLAFSGRAQPDGFWVEVSGTQGHAEANLFEPPRVTVRRLRTGEPAVAKLYDGIIEARDVFQGTLASFLRKLSGRSSYDGLFKSLEQTYRCLENKEPIAVTLDDIDDVARLVARFSEAEYTL